MNRSRQRDATWLSQLFASCHQITVNCPSYSFLKKMSWWMRLTREPRRKHKYIWYFVGSRILLHYPGNSFSLSQFLQQNLAIRRRPWLCHRKCQKKVRPVCRGHKSNWSKSLTGAVYFQTPGCSNYIEMWKSFYKRIKLNKCVLWVQVPSPHVWGTDFQISSTAAQCAKKITRTHCSRKVREIEPWS